MKQKAIHWFWAHRRKASIHHFSFLMHGLRGKGWAPAVNFWFDNQLIVGVPEKGAYVFYDRNQLKSGAKYKDVQDSIDANPDFVSLFRRRTDEIFGAVFFQCLKIDAANLSLLPNGELGKLYREFLDAVMIAPLITVQLWGIEACFDENYRILTFLRKRLRELGKPQKYQEYKELLAVNTGETVAFTEQKDFYRVCTVFVKNKKLLQQFRLKTPQQLVAALGRFSKEQTLVHKHMEKYAWLTTEYTGTGWSEAQWMKAFQTALKAKETPLQKLRALEKTFQSHNAQRTNLLQELNPPKAVLHALEGLAELIAQRDWTKGYMTKALLSYHTLLDEIGRRMGLTRAQIFHTTYQEVEEYFNKGNVVSKKELENRQKHGAIVLIKHGVFSLITGKEKIRQVIRREKVDDPFTTLSSVKSFIGLAASSGVIRAKARVIENASEIGTMKEGEILVTYMTTIEFVPAFRKAKGVVTDEGGMSCHAAIISREFRLPCVVGTKVATRVVQTGDEIEVNGAHGTVRIVKQANNSNQF